MSSPGDQAAILTTLGRTLGRETHVLSRYPAILWQQLFNRLQWEGGPTAELSERERLHRSGPRETPWVRASTPLGESTALIRALVGHEGLVWDCKVSSCGSFVVSASFDNTLRLWDPKTGADLAVLRGHSGEVLACEIAPDNSFIVSASTDRTLKIWDVSTRATRHTLTGHTDEVSGCLLSPDGELVVSTGKDGTMRVWSVGTGREILSLKGHTGQVNSCAMSHDGRVALSAGRDGILNVWDVSSGNLRFSLKGHTQPIRTCAVQPGGPYAVSAGKDRTARVWDLETGAEVRTLSGFKGEVSGCVFSPDGSSFVSLGLDFKIWNVESWDERASMEGHRGEVRSCAYSPDGTLVVSGGSDHDLRVWDAQTGSEIVTLDGHSNAITECTFLPDGRSVVSASMDHTVRIWETPKGSQSTRTRDRLDRQECPSHSSRITCLAFSPDGSFVASGSGGTPDRLALWEGEGLAQRAVMTGHDWPAGAIDVSPDSSFVVSRAVNMLVWDSSDGRQQYEVPSGPETMGHAQGVADFAIGPASDFIVSAGGDHLLKVWDSRTGALRATLAGHRAEVSGCSVSPDGRFIVSASADRTLRFWDLESESTTKMLFSDAAVRGCAISPDSSFVLSAEGDKRLKVWDAATGIQRGCLDHLGKVTDFCISSDSFFVVTADRAGSLTVWDPLTCAERLSLMGHTREIWACGVTHDAKNVVSVSNDDTLRVWDAHTGLQRAMIALPGGVFSLALHPFEARAVCGDRTGNLQSLEFVGLEYQDLVLNAVDMGEDPRARCPACFRPISPPADATGTEAPCPHADCPRSLWFVSSGPGHPPQEPSGGNVADSQSPKEERSLPGDATIREHIDGTYVVIWNEEVEPGRSESYGRDFQTREEATAFVRSKWVNVRSEEEYSAGDAETEGDPTIDLLAGVAHAKAEHWAEAARAFESVARKHPDNAQARHCLGVAYCALDRVEEGVRELEAAIRLDPEVPEAHHHLGVAYTKMARQHEAIGEFEAVVRLRPDDGDAHFTLALAHVRLENLTDGIREARRAAELGHGPAKEFLAGLG